MDHKLDKLELLILDLGEEIYKLKQRVSMLNKEKAEFDKKLKVIEEILEEQEILTRDNFDLMMEMNASKGEVEDTDDVSLESELKKFQN